MLLTSILQRKSQPVLDGEIPADELRQILACALTAPDHKRLRPWHYILCNPEHKQRLREVIVAAEQPAGLDLASRQERLAKIDRKINAAPHIVICLLRLDRRGLVPEIEQILSAGAGIQSMVIAAEALGHGCYWRTGDWAYSPVVRQGLQLDSDTVITGFLGLGKLAGDARLAKAVRPDLDAHVQLLGEVPAHRPSAFAIGDASFVSHSS